MRFCVDFHKVRAGKIKVENNDDNVLFYSFRIALNTLFNTSIIPSSIFKFKNYLNWLESQKYIRKF